MKTQRKNPPADSPAALLTAALSPDAGALRAIEALRTRLDEAEHQIVFEMRQSGASWQQIATATGMNSRQAAQKRYENSAGLVDRLAHLAGRPQRPEPEAHDLDADQFTIYDDQD